MKLQYTVESTIKPLDESGAEYIGYISFVNPFQNIYCEISESREHLEVELAKRVRLLKSQLIHGQEKVHHTHTL